MSSSAIVRASIEHFKENELIFASRLYKEQLSDQVTEAAYYKVIERMCKSGQLIKIAKGTYHLPKRSRYGILPPSEKEIVQAFTQNHTGMVIGYTLYNALNLTTQIPKKIEVFSSMVEGYSKSIRNVIIHQVPIVFTEDVKIIMESMEVLQNFGKIQDLNYAAFIQFAKSLASCYTDEAFEKVIACVRYKKVTIAFLQEILHYYNVPNHLSKYLSTLSEYKHPRMEELYEVAGIS